MWNMSLSSGRWQASSNLPRQIPQKTLPSTTNDSQTSANWSRKVSLNANRGFLLLILLIYWHKITRNNTIHNSNHLWSSLEIITIIIVFIIIAIIIIDKNNKERKSFRKEHLEDIVRLSCTLMRHFLYSFAAGIELPSRRLSSEHLTHSQTDPKMANLPIYQVTQLPLLFLLFLWMCIVAGKDRQKTSIDVRLN